MINSGPINLRDYISNIFNHYPFKSKDSVTFTHSPLANAFRKGINYTNDKNKIINGNLFSKGSAGIARWSAVPWFGIFDQSITLGAQSGIYIVYLFAADGSKVYLSLNQGWTQFYNKHKARNEKNVSSKARTDIKNTASELRGIISYNGNKFNESPINLKSNGQLPVGYEFGNILSIEYDKNKLPNNNILVSDLIDVIQIFKDLKHNLSFDDSGYKKTDNYNDYIKKIKGIAYREANIQNVKFHPASPLRKGTNEEKRHRNNNKRHNPFKKDYVKSEDIQTKLGAYGENVVIKMEKDKLNNSNELSQSKKKELIQNIKHVSKYDDSLGYDILSFDEHGRKKYIEVKSTTSVNDIPFNISKNELEKSDKLSPYVIYRLYNVNILSYENNSIPYYTISNNSRYGSIRDQLNLKASSYSAVLKK